MEPSTSSSTDEIPVLPKCLKRYEPYFVFQSYDAKSKTFKMKCQIEPRCTNNHGKGISAPPISASNLMKHIKHSHRAQMDIISKAIASAEATTSSATQPKLTMFARSTGAGASSSNVRPKQADEPTINATVDLLISEILPVSFVERPGFLKFMEDMCPHKKGKL